jgi:DNA-binding CsgD family transcriptional regulator
MRIHAALTAASCIAYTTPELPHVPDAPCSARVVVFLREIGDTPQLPGELLARHYGITPAEHCVLMSLIQGMSPQETAEAFSCSETTVRTHLQHLFAKTRTRGQPDLIRLAMSALAPAVINSGAAGGQIASTGRRPSALNLRAAPASNGR